MVDSDDWVDADAYRQVLDTLRKFVKEQTPVDMLLTNYVYEKVSEHHQRMRQIVEQVYPLRRFFRYGVS